MSFPSSLPTPATFALTGGPTLRWGIMAPGTIATNFTRAVHGFTDQRVLAVGSRSLDRAEAFAREHGVDRAYGDYEALVADPGIDIVYIASPHSEHRAQALLAIAAGKHVLIEKPMAPTEREARDIVDAARAAGVFAMEAMWARYQPQTVLMRQLIDDGVLGEPTVVAADAGFRFPDDPNGRMLNPELAGGGLLDLGVYTAWFAHFALGAPRAITATGSLARTGVDQRALAILDYASGAQAVMSTDIVVQTPGRASIAGPLARLEVDPIFLFPSGFTLHEAGGSGAVRFDDSGPRGGDGLAWQAAGVARHIADGLTESPWHSLDTTLDIIRILDEVRTQVGYPPR